MKPLHKASLPLVLLLVAATHQTSTASPLVSIGDNTDIFFNGSSNVQSSSNVFRRETDEESDIMLSLKPGFELNVGRGASNLDFSVVTQYEIRRYADLNDLDTELFSIQANSAYQTSRLDLSGSVFFREQKAATSDSLINDLVESDVTGGRIDSEYRFSPKFSFGAGYKYNETEYKDQASLADRERFTIPLDLFYELTPKVDLSVGYSYGETDVAALVTPARAAYTTEDHFFNVGARGNLLPKLTGFFKVGYRDRDSDRANASSNSTLGLDSNLTWAATPKLTNTLALSRDFGVGGEGTSSEDTSINLSSSYAINSNYAASAFVGYSLRDYANDREDKQYRLGLRLNYTPNQYWRFGAGYTYSENDSDDPTQAPNRSIRSFQDHTFDLTASLRY